MEHYCGHLKAGLRSHSHPWMDLNNKILHKAYIEFTDVFYGLEDQQILVPKLSITNEETTYAGCRYYLHFQIIIYLYIAFLDPLSNLRKPHIKTFQLDQSLQKKIAIYFSLILDRKVSIQTIEKALPDIMPFWRRVQIASGGDCIRTSSVI